MPVYPQARRLLLPLVALLPGNSATRMIQIGFVLHCLLVNAATSQRLHGEVLGPPTGGLASATYGGPSVLGVALLVIRTLLLLGLLAGLVTLLARAARAGSATGS